VASARLADALEFLGTAAQNGNTISTQGFLNHVSGLPDDSLFSGPNRRAATARFTFISAGHINGRYLEGNMIVTTSTQVLTITFRGRSIASFSVHFQDMLNVQAPNVGEETGSAWAVQTAAGIFHLGAHSYRFGRLGLNERFFTTGEGRRTQATPPKSEFALAGNATVLP
jgi:hypothetical protein